MKSKIAHRSLIYLVVALLTAGLLAWLGYMFMSAGRTFSSYQEEMLDTATALAQIVASHSKEEDGRFNHESCQTCLTELETVVGLELWVVDARYEIIAGHGEARRNTLASLSADIGDVIATAFAGEKVRSIRPFSLENGSSVTVGVPITDAAGKVIGVLIAHESAGDVDIVARRGGGTMALSLFIGSCIVLGGAILMLPGIAAPIIAVEEAAGRVAEGDYAERIGVYTDDEIGALAGYIDRMALRFEELEAEREQAELGRREFLENTARELRIPLNAVARLLDAHEAGTDDDAQISAEELAFLRGENQRIGRLIGDLTDIVAMQSRDYRPNMEPVDLRDIALEVMDAMQPKAAEKGVEIVQSSGADPMPFVGDRARLAQMLTIAVDNAIRYAPKGTTVIVGPIIRASAYTWSVVDWGDGIDAEQLPHIFNRYYRGDKYKNNDGIGLGLAIARQIADSHGIHIEVDSRPGKTEFIFIFPAGPKQEDTAEPPE